MNTFNTPGVEAACRDIIQPCGKSGILRVNDKAKVTKQLRNTLG